MPDHSAVPIGFWMDYTPVLTASTTDPTLGSGSSQLGRYTVVGETVIGWALIVFGSSGAAAGSGAYRLSIPLAPRDPTQQISIGSGYIRDNDTTNKWTIVGLTQSGNSYLNLRYGLGQLADVDNDSPIVFANSDSIALSFHYELA